MENTRRESMVAHGQRFNPAEIPAYSVAQVAFCLGLPYGTLEYWLEPRTGPLVLAPDPRPMTLCFKNLVECHVLRALRVSFRLPMRNIKRGVLTLRAKWNTRYPLAEKELSHDGLELFLEEWPALYNVSRFGNQAFSEVVRPYLERIDRDPRGVARRFFPILTKGPEVETQPRFIVIDPKICFGNPVIDGTRITTSVVAGRFRAGERLTKLAKQYGRSEEEIRAAIQFETRRRTA